MGILEISAAAESALRKKANARSYAELVRAIAMRWTPQEAHNMGLGSKAVAALESRRNHIGKSAVDPASTVSGNWADALTPEGKLASEFLGSLSEKSIFDAMYPDMISVPIRTLIGFISAGGTAAQIGEGQAKKFTELDIGNTPIEELKAIGILCFTKELLKLSSFAATSLFQSELEKCVAKTTDEQFVSILTTGISGISSTGYVRRDLRSAFAAISGDANSKYYILLPSSEVKKLSFAENEDGSEAFPDLSPTGGFISKVPVLPSDSFTGKMVVADASQVAANAGTIETNSAQHASLQFDTAPDSPPTTSTVQQSLWQQGKMAVKAERWFCAKRIRTAAVAVITNINYSGNADSPA